MMATAEEKRTFQEDPNSFVNDIQQLLSEDKSVTIRQSINDLLGEMCELIDETLNFVVELCVEILK